ncbi:MAG: hypothetical protein FWG18_04045 [Alphaproteobacteria bacterium]|nr:hypothetical protein [Alphaproteobacteria bacterium]
MDSPFSINFAEIIDYIHPVAQKIHDELLLSKDQKLAVFGGFVRDAVLANAFDKPRPKFKDVDVVMNKKPAELDGNPNIQSHYFNYFGGAIMKLNGISVEIFSRDAEDFKEFIGITPLNCNRLIYIFKENKLYILPEFYKFVRTKTISIVAPGFQRNPGGHHLNAFLTSHKLSQRFEMNIGVSNDIKSWFQNAPEEFIKKSLQIMYKKMRMGELSKNILTEFQNIRK